MTRKDLQCIHEPFGDAFYFGPERLSSRYEADVKAREESGFSDSTFKSVFDEILKQAQGVRMIFCVATPSRVHFWVIHLIVTCLIVMWNDFQTILYVLSSPLSDVF